MSTNKRGAAAFCLADPAAFAAFSAEFTREYPWLCFGTESVRGEESRLRCERGAKVWWIYEGAGEVYLPRGYRTKEGDGQRLPPDYQAEPMSDQLVSVLSRLRDGLSELSASARAPVAAILDRWRDGAYRGDYANDLWKLEHVDRPWSHDRAIEHAIESLFGHCAEAGYSVKLSASFERVMEGDQIFLGGGEEARVRGTFRCLTLENRAGKPSPVSGVRRLRYLKDSAGGCNFDFDPFRRLPLTWQLSAPGETGDGINFVNSHVVNIAKETSPTHFHPRRAVGGGLPQHEFYLVLDPRAYGLNTRGRTASIIVFPKLSDLRQWEEIQLQPGDFVSIPPGIGHRGMDVFVNVITVPGFKPHNEYYLDADIASGSGGVAPFNAGLVALKNYESLAALVGA